MGEESERMNKHKGKYRADEVRVCARCLRCHSIFPAFSQSRITGMQMLKTTQIDFALVPIKIGTNIHIDGCTLIHVHIHTYVCVCTHILFPLAVNSKDPERGN